MRINWFYRCVLLIDFYVNVIIGLKYAYKLVARIRIKWFYVFIGFMYAC